MFHLCMHPATCVWVNTSNVANAGWLVIANYFYLASYLFPYFLLRSLLPFLNSNLFLKSYLIVGIDTKIYGFPIFHF